MRRMIRQLCRGWVGWWVGGGWCDDLLRPLFISSDPQYPMILPTLNIRSASHALLKIDSKFYSLTKHTTHTHTHPAQYIIMMYIIVMYIISAQGTLHPLLNIERSRPQSGIGKSPPPWELSNLYFSSAAHSDFSKIFKWISPLSPIWFELKVLKRLAGWNTIKSFQTGCSPPARFPVVKTQKSQWAQNLKCEHQA